MPGGVAELFGASTTLLAGYLFIRWSPYRRYSVEALRSDRYALHVFGYSLPLYLAGSLVPHLAHGFAQVDVRWLREAGQALKSNGVPSAAVFAILIAPIASFLDGVYVLILMHRDEVVRKPGTLLERARRAAVARHVRKSNDSGLRTVYRATAMRKRLMVTLKSGKVYIGEPKTSMLEPALLDGFIRLIPFASGYRDKDTKELEITNYYYELQQHLALIPNLEEPPQSTDAEDPLRADCYELSVTKDRREIIDIEDLGVVLSWADVESFAIFDEHVNAFMWARRGGEEAS
ncbi:MAG TPA: hypothetical protein VGN43_15115 [Steroidobacteraceae bacterium]|nr:hypothetical protein [Steroidobacteraceae bacterium]